MFIFGSLIFGGLAYNLFTHGPLLAWDARLASTLPAIGLQHLAILKPIMAAGFYMGKEVIIAFLLPLNLYRSCPASNHDLDPGQHPGFPSGHAVATVTFYGLLAYLLGSKITSSFWKVVVVAVVLLIIGFVGFSRIFTGGHYLTDILSGYAVGIAWSGAVYTLIELYFQKRRTQNVKKE